VNTSNVITLPVSKESLEADLIAALTEATKTTLQMMCSLEAKAKPSETRPASNKSQYDIAATIGLMNKEINGNIALGFPEEVFLKIMSNMLHENVDGITSEVEDGCGELLNIIFGSAKKVLQEKGHSFGKTLPNIIIGHSLKVRQLTPLPVHVITFELPFGKFYLEVGYKLTAVTQAAA